MICFKVKINGKEVGTAGSGDRGTLMAMLSLSHLPDERKLEFQLFGSRPYQPKEKHDDLPNVFKINATSQMVIWGKDRPIQAGDSIVIDVVEQDSCDEPSEIRTPNIAEIREQAKEFYAEMARQSKQI